VNGNEVQSDWKAIVLDLMGDIDLYSVTLLVALVAGFTAVFLSIAGRIRPGSIQRVRKLTLIAAFTGFGFAGFSTIFHFWYGHQSELPWSSFLKAHPSFLVAYFFCLLSLLLIPHGKRT
jgi:hypothetical protein